jgi:solute carrier family 25 oxoglutarate transporter 11
MQSEIKNLSIGAVSGIIPLSITLPIDYVKVTIQVQAEGVHNYRPHPFNITKEVFKSKGISEFYKGLPGAIQRQIILSSLRLGGYKIALEKINSLRTSGPLSLFGQSVTGFTVGGLAAWVASPFDLVLIRLQSDRLLPVDKKRHYTGTFNALYRIVTEEGFFHLWKGASTVVLRVAVINGISIPGYELIKKELDDLYGFGASHRLYASMISAVISCVVSLPIDNIKTKVQKMVKNKDGSEPYKNTWDCCKKSVQREGIKGLYVGFPVYVTRIAPHVILSMLIQDLLHHHF